MTDNKIYIKNKKPSFEYETIQTYTAGIVLTGTEIKSIREGKANVTEAFCYFHNNELWCKGMHISEYSFGSYNNHTPDRERKLLLNRRELNKMEEKLKPKVPARATTKSISSFTSLARLKASFSIAAVKVS